MTENALKLDFMGEKKQKQKQITKKKRSNLIKESRVSIIHGDRSLNDLSLYILNLLPYIMALFPKKAPSVIYSCKFWVTVFQVQTQ